MMKKHDDVAGILSYNLKPSVFCKRYIYILIENFSRVINLKLGLALATSNATNETGILFTNILE